MTISLNQISKRYKDTWVFKNVNYQFESDKSYALLGANGSGKSTLLRIIGGIQLASQGNIYYQINQESISTEKIFQQLSYCAPGMDLIEEMRLSEFLQFHFNFKKKYPNVTINTILDELQMQKLKHKFIHEFSSGMKQRVKLAQAIFADTALILLDEPCSNLDIHGVNLYNNWIKNYTKGRLLILASNDKKEYEQIDKFISIEDYHKKA